ncbi:Hypp1720 [Branchiostoma lanceolatum]|uniref:Hypp1720 protein n=1 Tax=Branchiostoma lanceolatum TaxID=7740 RepID=A0A8J9ZK14_BRALA|nr:Hypp1720 [Branchiostoma lanceolatum]
MGIKLHSIRAETRYHPGSDNSHDSRRADVHWDWVACELGGTYPDFYTVCATEAFIRAEWSTVCIWGQPMESRSYSMTETTLNTRMSYSPIMTQRAKMKKRGNNCNNNRLSDEPQVRVAVVGDSSVGKSADRWCHAVFTDIPAREIWPGEVSCLSTYHASFHPNEAYKPTKRLESLPSIVLTGFESV